MEKSMMPIMLVMIILMVVSIIFAAQGVNMHAAVSREEARFHSLQDQYFSNSKETRDSAPTNSPLTDQLVEIQNFPSELLRLKLVGVGKILTGIFVLLFAILIALMMMPKRLSQVIKKG